MKLVLISIQPYWMFLIIAHKMGWQIGRAKMVEVRKNYPKSEDWDKTVKLYCSKDKKSFARIPKEYQLLMEQFLGKVIGEFVCDKIIDIDYGIEEGVYFDGEYQKGFETNGNGDNPTCLSFVELENYLTNNEGYGWHISNLVIYDKPRELREFQKPCIRDCDCGGCEYAYWTQENGFEGCMLEDGLKRPPQSWCYVERSDTNDR